MKKTILLATDFSPAATNAAEYAADMAAALHAELLLLHVFQPAVSFGGTPVLITLVDIKEAADKSMNELKEKLIRKTNGKITIETEVSLGNFFLVLKESCDSVKPYAVVMGSQGTSATERFIFGSHSVYAMKKLEWPLITVPKTASFSAVKRIGLACDLSNTSRMIDADELRILVNDFNAELHILNVDRKSSFTAGSVYESGVLLERLKDLDPQYHFIDNEDIDEGVMEFAGKFHIDLLLVIPRRHNLFEKLLHKSHTKQFVLHSHVPVMALHHSHA